METEIAPISSFGRFLSRLGISKDVAYFKRKAPLSFREIMKIKPDDKLSVSEQFYHVRASPHQVFQAYTLTPPNQIWPRDRLRFHSVFLPGETRPWTPDKEWPGIQVGERFFCDLMVLPPFQWLFIYVGIEVTLVENNRSIRYDYLEDSVTVGFNKIRFEAHTEKGEKGTRIHHYSEYRGTSLRDRLLMPIMQKYLHVGFVDALHLGMKKRIEKENHSLH